MAGTNTPGISGLGHSTYLVNGSWVVGMFIDNECYQDFIVMGSVPSKSGKDRVDPSKGFCDSSNEFPRILEEPDNNRRVRGGFPSAEDIQQSYGMGRHQPKISPYNPEYPHNHVYETTSGHIKEFDDTPGHERVLEKHRSGTYYEIYPDGSKVTRVNGDNYSLIVGTDTLEVTGNVHLVVGSDVTITVAGSMEARVDGNIYLDGQSNNTVFSLGKTFVTAGDDINISTAKVCNITAQDDINIKSFKKINMHAVDDINITSDADINIKSGTDNAKNIYLND